MYKDGVWKHADFRRVFRVRLESHSAKKFSSAESFFEKTDNISTVNQSVITVIT